MLDLLFKTFADLKEPAILWRLFIPFVAAIILVSLLGYGIFGVFLVSDMVMQNPFVTEVTQWTNEAEQTIGSIPFVGAALLWVLGLVFAVIAGVLGVLLGSYLILLFAMLITAFMTDSLVKAVHDKHYPNVAYQGHGSLLGMTGKLLWFGFLLLLLFIVTIPMLFIPLVNLIWFWLLGFLFFRYSLVLDVGQVILPEALFNQVKDFGNWPPTLALGALFLLSTMPLVGLFIPVLAVIALAHYYFEILRGEQEAAAVMDSSPAQTQAEGVDS
ncbi:EI24 domain-containing protein [Thiomicrorhabdus sediminis]|uniref:EI24 domain-containing protein n=1 Tax=Thiomicrorhabdus sediminis TaxID=2580412 RepID=A0A4P9K709_9GAMM|nr:EI24 domain-containing protein [Thiomicrorhabdus sediminis]QCU90872.1 EI24 domain-containing protein [Thiomicrorhabdus sediminis]